MEESYEAFVQALIKEIRLAGASNPAMPVHTIFFGGGTPSLLTPLQYQEIFAALYDAFTITADAHICLESNPNDLTAEYVTGLYAVGFNRLSIGMQSANAAHLALYEREHDMQMVADAVSHARAAGFENVSLDIIYGAPNETLAEWEQTVTQALALEPEHLSVYGLTLERNTPLRVAVESNELPQPNDDLTADMYEQGSNWLEEAGFQQYEISNWAREGYESRHNLQYWRNQPYLGLGPGAHGYAADTRTIVMRYPQKYIKTLQADSTPRVFPRTPVTSKAVSVDRETEIAETLMMGLRLTREGIQREAFRKRFDVDVYDLHGDTIERFVQQGLMHCDEHTLRLTRRARLISNAVISYFI